MPGLHAAQRRVEGARTMTDEKETSHAFARSRSNVGLDGHFWLISKYSKKGLIHYWNTESKNPDFVRSICNTFTRKEYLRIPNGKHERTLCPACKKRVSNAE